MATKSIFYEAATRPMNFTFLMAETLAIKQQEIAANPDAFSDVSLGDVLREVVALKTDDEPTLGQLEYLVDRVRSNSVEPDKKTGKPKALKADKDFAGALSEWIRGLTAEQVCLWLSDYDIHKADNLYCITDIEDVRAMLNLKVEQLFQSAKVSMESALFGFGGGYKKSGNANTTVHDMSENASEGQMAGAYDALKKLGF